MNRNELNERLPEFLHELRFAEKSKRTLSKYKADIKKFINSIDHDKDITKEDVMAFKESVCNGEYKPASINSYIVATNKYLRWLGLDALVVKKLKLQQKSSLEEVITTAEFNKLLRNAKKYHEHDIYMIMKILAGTGIRISELRFFTVENVTKSFYIEVRNKGKNRTIIVPQELAREIKKYCKTNKIKTGEIFTLNEVYIWRKLKYLAAMSSVKKTKVHAHSFRHLFAKEYIKQFNNPLELADILGHNSLETTRIYTRSTNQEKRKNLESMRMKESRGKNE